MTEETGFWSRLDVEFNGHLVTIHLPDDQTATQARRIFRHLLTEEEEDNRCVLQLRLHKVQEDFFELEESGKSRLQGSGEYILYHIRERVSRAFVAACPDLLWLHAGAAVCDEGTVLLPGSAGAGKSTLTTGLIDRGWKYIADDIVPVDPERHCMLPFPLATSVRSAPPREGEGWDKFLRQDKKHCDFRPEQICAEPVPIATIIFPEYSTELAHGTVVKPLSPMTAAVALLSQCICYETQREKTIGKLFSIVRSVPSCSLIYKDHEPALSRIAKIAASRSI